MTKKKKTRSNPIVLNKIEDVWIAKAIQKGQTGEYINVENFMSTLK